MKKFYTLVLLMVAWAVTGYATTSMYQLDIDHADRVKVKINYEEKTGLKDGINGSADFPGGRGRYRSIVLSLQNETRPTAQSNPTRSPDRQLRH